jgi:prevent-host-death family protein
VQATLTELRRKTGLVMSPVVHGGKSVDITSGGKVVACVVPRPQCMTGTEFAKLWRNRRRLGPKLAGEIMAAIEGMNKAEHEPVD